MRFQLNAPDVIQETIEGEVIVVHLVSGSYYSLLGSGVTLWNGLLAGLDAQELSTLFVPPADPEVIRAFVAELQQEQLLTLASEPQPAAEPSTRAALPGGPFSPPQLQKFSDMQELLLVDPIHEVKPQGWPLTKEQ